MIRLVFLATSILVATAFVPGQSIEPARSLAVRFGRLWDGTRLVTDATVVIRGNRVVSVTAGRSAVPKGVDDIDLRRYTGIPGLIDQLGRAMEDLKRKWFGP